jgi:hypothetical protein
MVGRPAGYFWINTPEVQLAEIKLINEHINDPDGVVFRDVVFKTFWK